MSAAPAATSVRRELDLPTLRALVDAVTRRVWVWIATWAVIGSALAALIALGPLERVPHVQDEIVYELQARTLASGKLWQAEQFPRAAHHFEFVINADGRRFGVFPNGWPAVLALGVLLHVPWLVNPLLHGLTVVVTGALARRVGGARAALIVAPLLALCPGAVIMAASRMSHTLAALLSVIAGFFVCGMPATRRGVLAAGGALGWLILTRPLDAVCVAFVLFVVLAARQLLTRYAWALFPIALAVVLVALQNWVLAGSPLRFPQNEWFARGEITAAGEGAHFTAVCNNLGFGPGHGCFQVWGQADHSLRRGLDFAILNWKLAAGLWFGALPIALGLVFAFWQREFRRFSLTAGSIWLILSAAYATYWYHGACYGPRFHHAALPYVMVVLALGFTALAQRTRWLMLAALLPFFAYFQRFAEAVPELRGYWGVDGRLDALEKNWDRGPALFLVAYGGGRARVWASLPNTSERFQPYAAVMRRGMWINHERGLIDYAEYQPGLLQELERHAAGRKPYLLVLHAERSQDYLVSLSKPLEAKQPCAVQVADLPLPQKQPYFRDELPGALPMKTYYEP